MFNKQEMRIIVQSEMSISDFYEDLVFIKPVADIP